MKTPDIIPILVHVTVLLILPPLLLGVIGKTKAFFAGRVGPPFLQLYFDLFKLLRKGSVFSTTTTWVFRAGPVVGLATALAAGLLVPLGNRGAPLSFSGDFLLFAALFALGRFFTAAAAMDTGSSFEGMGAAREVTFSCLAEPTLFFGFLVLAKLSSSLSLSTMLGAPVSQGWELAGASLMMVVASLFIVLLVENSRIPFDDPNTHLELTMIHEVMVLDHSGSSFGMILYGAAMKLFVVGALLLRIVLPLETPNACLNWSVFIAGMLGLSILIGILESIMARFRLVFVPTFLVGACLLSAFGIILLVR